MSRTSKMLLIYATLAQMKYLTGISLLNLLKKTKEEILTICHQLGLKGN